MGEFNKKTIKDINVRNKYVLLRADFNVPINNGKVTSNFRIKQTLQTINYLIDHNCKIVIISHLGRPKSSDDKEYSLKPVAKELSKLLKREVTFAADCISDEASEAANNLKPQEILLLENLRFYKQEKANDKPFAKRLLEVSNAEVFVQDAFGVVHRAHASTDAITKDIQSVSGLLLEEEYRAITKVIESPEKPLMAIIGGAKIADKIDILNKFIKIADVVVVGGAMANTFLYAQGTGVGKSLKDDDEVDIAKEIIEKASKETKKRGFTFYIPQDVVVSKKIDSKAKTRIVDFDTHSIADIESYPKRPAIETHRVAADEMILDIGPFSSAFIVGAMQLCRTVVWNGTMGVTEVDALNDVVGPFARGTQAIIDGLVGHYGNRAYSLIGGGDTTGYIDKRGLNDMFSHVSTGGGASLDLLSGKKLPGISVLWDK